MNQVFLSLLTASIGWTLFQIVGTLVNLPLHLLADSYPLNGPIGAVLGALVVLALYRRRNCPAFRGMLLDGGLRNGIRLCLPLWIYLLLSHLLELLFFPVSHTMPTLLTVSISCFAGFGEELCFRGLLLSELMRHVRHPEELVPGALVSAVCFGAVHAANLLVGADPASTLLQIVSSCLAGFFWAAAFLRSGSLWPCILSHVLLDVLAMLSVSQSSGLLTTGISPGFVADALLSLVLCLAGLWLLREEKRQEILTLWARKWGRELGNPD